MVDIIMDEVESFSPYLTDSGIFRLNDLCRLQGKDRYDLINISNVRRYIEMPFSEEESLWTGKNK